jgi:hypothetical protein
VALADRGGGAVGVGAVDQAVAVVVDPVIADMLGDRAGRYIVDVDELPVPARVLISP